MLNGAAETVKPGGLVPVDENLENRNPDAGDTDEEFNPEKAWNLIENLRADNAKLKTTNESNAARLREIEDAKLTGGRAENRGKTGSRSALLP